MSPRIALLCLLLIAPAEKASTDDHFQVTKLAPNLLMLSTDQGSYSNNSLAFTGPDGLLLVDTHSDADATALRSFVDGLGMGAPKYIINTHRHVEHIGGNHIFGAEPVVVAHRLFPEKLKSGTYLFAEYPPETFPDITFADTLELTFNNELIRLIYIGGSHDDNEILVHFTGRRIAHISSVVNGFNFPSVDSDGDVLQFEARTRQLMELLPQDTRLVSGHHGRVSGYDFVGAWDQLPAYADMMKDTIGIVRRELAGGKSLQEMQEAGVLDAYSMYAGSYVSTEEWLEYAFAALTGKPETRNDFGPPVYAAWKRDGADAAVQHYRHLLETQGDQYDFNEYLLVSIGSKLYARERYDDAVTFLLGSTGVYPDSKYAYYAHYLAAMGLHKLGRGGEAIEQCRASIRMKSDFDSALNLLAELTGNGE